jgi:hypothetical protein
MDVIFIRPGNEKDAIMCIIVLIGMVALFSMVKGEK